MDLLQLELLLFRCPYIDSKQLQHCPKILKAMEPIICLVKKMGGLGWSAGPQEGSWMTGAMNTVS